MHFHMDVVILKGLRNRNQEIFCFHTIVNVLIVGRLVNLHPDLNTTVLSSQVFRLWYYIHKTEPGARDNHHCE